MDTIVALSSGHLPSGVAVIRGSGSRSRMILERFDALPKTPRVATLRALKDPSEEIIDTGLVIWFPSPSSFTGEDVFELQSHGSPAVVAKLLDLACSMEGVRLAEPGEFARRAFTNGKIDLTEAEGLADLIDAETEAQRKVAQVLVSGALRELYSGWQDQLLNARALIEADIDFADEDDVPGSVADQVWSAMDVLRTEIQDHVNGYDRSERIRSGFRISLIGAPNVGKSSLLNALAGSDRAIVSSEAGTTRDILEVRLNLGGYLVLLTDTAGIRKSTNAIEAEGIRRAVGVAKASDLVLHLSDTDSWNGAEIEGLGNVIRVRTKTDLSADNANSDAEYAVTVKEPESITLFIDGLTGLIEDSHGKVLSLLGVKNRHLTYLKSCMSSIDSALLPSDPLEVRAECLRAAAYELGRITGQHDTEDVLGRIFSSFCIGK